jgi:Fe-S cluster assembly scaffold protein SufB
MNDNTHFIVNRIPSLTWNWLHMNETDLKEVPAGKPSVLSQDIPEGISVRESTESALSDLKTGMGANIDRLVKASQTPIHVLETESHAGRLQNAHLDFDYAGSSAYTDAVEISVEENTELTVVMNFRSKDKEEATAALQTRYHVAPYGKLNLVQINYLPDSVDFLNDIGGQVEDHGDFRLIQLILGGRNNYYGSFTELSGYKSNLATDIGYIVTGRHKLDMNYVANHNGRKSNCDINASGVLRDSADKLFRGTIDFHRGCGGSTGTEMENVLLMDENVINRTIPVILCDEEDVEGNHGASIGKLDEGLMFYLQSRGLTEEEIYEMMAQARIDAVAAKIPDDEAKAEIREFLGEE